MGVQPKHPVGRNDPCPCGSGLKYKKCHGDPAKVEICNRVANEKMVELIRVEQRKKIIRIQQANCLECEHTGRVEGDGQGYACPNCQYITDEERIEKEYKRLTKGENK